MKEYEDKRNESKLLYCEIDVAECIPVLTLFL